MPIDKLELLEFYVQVFAHDAGEDDPDEGAECLFSPPSGALLTETVAHASFDSGGILAEAARHFHNSGESKLAIATAEISTFLGIHGEELARARDAQYRVLEYVYPIV